MDSPTTMSLPSPGATSCSLDGDGGALSPPAGSVSGGGRRESASSGEVTPSLQGRVNVLQQRVSNLMQADRRVVLRDLAATLYPYGHLKTFNFSNLKKSWYKVVAFVQNNTALVKLLLIFSSMFLLG